MSCVVDKGKLMKAIFDEKKNGLFSLGQKIQDPIDLKGIFINNIGFLDVSLPLPEFQNALKLMDRTNSNNTRHKQIECENLYIIEPSCFHIESHTTLGFENSIRQLKEQAIQEMFSVSLDHCIVDVEASLESLVICGPEGTYNGCFNSEKRPGILALYDLAVPITLDLTDVGAFGSLLISVPVKDGCGGKVIISHYSQEVVYEFGDDSDSFYMISMAAEKISDGKQAYTIKPNGNTWIAFLTLSLVWMDAVGNVSIQPDEFPFFIQAVHEANQVLSVWHPSTEPLFALSSLEIQSSISPQKPSIKDIIENSPTVKSEVTDDKQDSNSKSTLTQRHLCLALANNYFCSNFDFSSLEEGDLFAFRVLRALNFIDVNLVVLVKNDTNQRNNLNCCCCNAKEEEESKNKVKNEISIKKNLVTFEPWNFDSTRNRNLIIDQLTLNVETQLLGNLRAKLENDANVKFLNELPSNENCDVHSNRNCRCGGGFQPGEEIKSFHPGMIIQPKWPVNRDKCKSALRDLNNRFPEAISKLAMGSTATRNAVILDIYRLTVQTFRADFNVTPSECTTVFMVPELLNCCIRLGAVEEAFQLLDVVINKNCPCGTHDWTSMYERMWNGMTFVSHLADLLALAGWNASFGFVVKLVESKTLSNLSMELSTKLYEMHFYRGAETVLDVVIKKLNTLDCEQMLDCPPKFVAFFMILLNHLKSSTNINIENKYSILMKSLSKLPLARLWNELEEFADGLNDDESNLLNKAMEEIAPAFTEVNLKAIPEHHFTKLLKSYSKCGSTDILEKFWNKVYEELNSECHLLSSGECLEKDIPLLHRTIFALNSNSERIALIENMTNFSKVANAILDTLAGTFPVKYKFNEDGKNEREIQQNLARLYIFISLAENEPNLTSEKRFELFCASFPLLKGCQLWKLIVDVYKEDGSRLKKRTSTKKMYQMLLQAFLTKDTLEIIQSAKDNFVEIVRCFSWFEDNSLLVQLTGKILNTSEISDSDQLAKLLICKMITSILNMPGIFGDVSGPNNAKINNNSFALILDTWVQLATSLLCAKSPGSELAANHVIEFYTAFLSSAKYFDEEGEKCYLSSFVHLVKLLDAKTVMDLLIEVMDHEMKPSGPSVFKYKSCLTNLTLLFQEFVSRTDFRVTFFSITDLNYATRLVQSFFWFGQENPLNEIFNLVCSFLSSDNHPLTDLPSLILQSTSIQQFSEQNHFGKRCYESLMDQTLNRIGLRLKPSWSLPYSNAKEQVVKTFLQSDVQQQVFGCYATKKGAENYAKRTIQPEWGIECRLVMHNKSKFGCLFVKKRPSCFLLNDKNHHWRKEYAALTVLRAKLANSLETSATNPLKKSCPEATKDPVNVELDDVPFAKRQKIDPVLIDID